MINVILNCFKKLAPGSIVKAIFNSLCGFSWLLVKPNEPEFPVCPTLI
jgi:hypothetical protein